jgi:tetratricopeptide (TPR) repeat protein
MSELDRARVLRDVGRYDDAVAAIQRALAAGETDAESYALLASVLHRADRHAEALKAADMAAAQDPEAEWAHRLRALALLGLKRTVPAQAAAEQAVRLAPEGVEARYVLAQVQMVNLKLADAEESARACIAINPNSELGHIALSQVLINARRWAEAEAACRRALAIDPNDPAARHNLGVAISRQRGRAVEGVQHLTEASKLDPTDSLSRQQAVAAGRAYVAGGAVAIYAMIQVVRVTAGSWSGSAVSTLLVALVILAVLAGWIAMRRRRLAQLPTGVAELVRRRGLQVGHRLGVAMFWSFVAVAALGVPFLLTEPSAGVSLILMGAALAAVTRWRTAPA